MFIYPKHYDVIVVGAGHAGVEAALAASRIGCETLLLTLNLDSIGQMSCNPAVGGIAKGHLVREIDALGGEMGVNADLCGIQARMLNRSKGPAVWAPRVQCDKKAYQYRLKWVCERQERLDCKQAETVCIHSEQGIALGVETSLGVRYLGKTVVITTGTFLHGLMHVGVKRSSGGRAGDAAATGLSASLRTLGLELGRLKTGTPPRLLKRSIDFNRLEPQHGDSPPPRFTHWPDRLFHVEQPETHLGGPRPHGSQFLPQIPCFLTYTTPATEAIIRDNLHLSPMYSGAIEGIGPRYCPSIEDKIVRFPDKERQQVFLEPEGIATDEIYPNGLSTCLPYEVQVQLVRSVVGCESAEIMRPAYAVEYDYVFPTQLRPTLETRACQNLFLAGQINGTSGYEEAAAQGIIAGINAASVVRGSKPLVLAREQAYIGVLIDDLVTKGTTEPYRMFTSRAEYRLLLRQDNADLRLSAIGHKAGLLPLRQARQVEEKQALLHQEIGRLQSTQTNGTSLATLLRRPGSSYRELPGARSDLGEAVVEQLEIQLKYEGYIARQHAEVQLLNRLNTKEIPLSFDYGTVSGIRTEARLKLDQVRPMTLGQAARISGVSPADIAIVNAHLTKQAQPKNLNSPTDTEPSL